MLSGRHFLNVDDLSAQELEAVLDLTASLKQQRQSGQLHPLLAGKSLAMIFLQPSNRTRVSFEVGMYQLGGKTVNIRPNEIRLGEREPVADVARVLSRYVDGIMMRVVSHSTLTEFSQFSSVPVINGLSDRAHPCQAVSDMFTIKEKKGKLKGLKLCYIGDGNNVCFSLLQCCRLLGLEMVVACPKGYEPLHEGLDSDCEISHHPEQAIAGADVVYTDVWTSMSQEDDAGRRVKKFKGFTVTEQLFAKAAPDAMFLHCLPAHRGQEVVHEVVEHPRSAVFDQAENRLHTQKAILALFMGQNKPRKT